MIDILENVVLTIRTRNLIMKNNEFAVFVTECIERHVNHDWGDVSDEDKAFNEQCPEMAMSIYTYREGLKIWVKSDSDGITVMLPYEY